MVAAEVGGEELLRLGDGDVQLGFDVDPHLELTRLHVEEMAAEGPVLGDEVEVVAGHVDRSGIERRPEPDQDPSTSPTVNSLWWAVASTSPSPGSAAHAARSASLSNRPSARMPTNRFSDGREASTAAVRSAIDPPPMVRLTSG